MQLRWSGRWELIPYVILLATLIMTAVTARYVLAYRAQAAAHRVQMDAESVRGAILIRLDTYVAMLLGGAGLVAARETVTRAEFERYVARLEIATRYPGIQGIGFSRRIRAQERDAVLAEIRRDLPDFEFWPARPPGDVDAIVYLEPPDERNRRALGYDMGSEANRREAMTRARDDATPAASGTVILVQEAVTPGEEQPGFLIYVPVYRGGGVPATVGERRDALEGFVYSPFRAGDLLEGVVGPELQAVAGYEVFDGAPAEGRLLYRSRRGLLEGRLVSHERTLDVAGRTWTIVLHGAEDLRADAGVAFVALVVVGGVTLSVLLFLLTRGQVVARRQAEHTAEKLRHSEEQLRAADRAKDDFLATISHELRTPLNAIVGWASMLANRDLPADLQTHAIGVIARNAAAQTRLVEDLLDMSRAAAGHLSLQLRDIDPRLSLKAAVEAVQPQAAAAGLTLDVDIPPSLGHIEADDGRLQQVVTNLLANAIKFTPAGGRVVLSARLQGEALAVRVSDTGIGIEPAFIPFVFEPFRQADSSSTRSHSGTGLGLAIARHLVELHGGRVAAASSGPGHGATFDVRIPVRQRRRA